MHNCAFGRETGCFAVSCILVISFLGRALANYNKHTALIRDLLRGYENLPPPGGPTVVSLGIYVNYFYAMSEQSMDYRLSFYMRQAWVDSRFVFNSTRYNNIKKLKVDESSFPQIWVPDVFFRNEKGASFHKVTQNNRLLYIKDHGDMWYVSKISATFSCQMKLRKYPMDRQSCPIQFESFGYTTDTVIYKWLPENSVQYDPLARELPEMVIESFEQNDCTYNDTSGYQPGEYPCLEVRFIATRPLGYFMIQFYIPSILLVILSWVSFWISVDAVVARVSIGLLTVLNLVTQSTGSRNQLPKVSYIKAIDVWMTVCLVFAFASLIEFAVVNVWSRMEARQKKQQSKDGGVGATSVGTSSAAPVPPGPGAGAGAAAGAVGGLGAGGKAKSEEQDRNDVDILTKQVTLQVVDQNPGRRTRRLSDISNILSQPLLSMYQHRAQTLDQLSRKVFPGTFLVFNIMYWVAYTLLLND